MSGTRKVVGMVGTPWVRDKLFDARRGNRTEEVIESYADRDDRVHGVRLNSHTFECEGRLVTVYRWETNSGYDWDANREHALYPIGSTPPAKSGEYPRTSDPRGEWTPDREKAIRDGKQHASERHYRAADSDQGHHRTYPGTTHPNGVLSRFDHVTGMWYS